MNISLAAIRVSATLAVATMAADAAETPQWLWFQKTSGLDERFFRKTFNIEGTISKAELIAAADDRLEAFVNGESIFKTTRWQTPLKADVTAKLRPGRNVLALIARNNGPSSAGVLATLDV